MQVILDIWLQKQTTGSDPSLNKDQCMTWETYFLRFSINLPLGGGEESIPEQQPG